MASISVSVQAPVGGWNTRDAIDDMPPEDAVKLENWFPNLGAVTVRNGFSSFCTGLGGNVETLMEFYAGPDRYFLACANNRVWNITAGTASNITGSATITSNRWQWAQYDDGSGGPRIGMVNGSDAPLIVTTGPTVSAMTISGTGLTAANLDGINIYKNRSYMWDSSTQDFWYSQTNALGGTMTKFPLSRVAGTTGNLLAMGTWTVDGGDGLDDLAVFLYSSGVVLIYQGDDPGSNWALVGRYYIGAPLGVRGLVQYGGDLLIMTKNGYIPLSSNLAVRRAQTISISDKINPEAARVAQAYASNWGWQAIHYAKGSYLLFNIPVSTALFEQHVMNTRTGAWCKFTGQNAMCWGLYNDHLYFGGASGVVYKADDTTQDNGSAVKADAITAWNYFGDRRHKKMFGAVKPILKSKTRSVVYGVKLVTDFNEASRPTPRGSSTVNDTFWGDPWGSPWTSGTSIVKDWWGTNAYGFAAAIRMQVNPVALQDVKWLSTDYLITRGGPI